MTDYWRARDVEKVAGELIADHHPHLDGVPITYLFRLPAAKSHGRTVYGKARKIGGMAAVLASRLPDSQHEIVYPIDFFVIEIAADVWTAMDEKQRAALVDHELCHLDVEMPEDEHQDRKLRMVGHDVEEFAAVIRRHGLWRDSVANLVSAAAEQLELALDDDPDDDAGGEPDNVLDLRRGSGVAIGRTDA